MNRMEIVFAGLGKMGLPMARHLQHAQHVVVGVKPDAVRRAAATAAGIRVVATLDDALSAGATTGPGPSHAWTVCSSLPDDAALLDVARTLRDSAASISTWIDTSTVSPAASAAAAALCAERGIDALRAPVSGNAVMAAGAQLMVLASGPRAAYARCETLLACWGPRRVYLGAGEQARTMKLVLNLMIAVTSGMLAEALTLGQRGGLAWETLWDTIAESAVGAPIVKAKASALRRRDYTPTFTVKQMRKDLALILAAGAGLQVALPLTALVEKSLRTADAQGDAALDYAAVIRVAERAAGLHGSEPHH